MEANLYLSTLTNLCDFVVGTSQMVGANGKGYKGEKSRIKDECPEAGGYPVVIKYKPRTITCTWCNEEAQLPNTKIIARTPGSQLWEGKCKDCKRRVTTPFKD
jgi:hypothetical protein